MDLKLFYLQMVKEDEYHYIFYNLINSNKFEYNLFDTEEVIIKFKELCQPNVDFNSKENKCWFYLTTYYLNKMGYQIRQFPNILSRPPENPEKFTYDEIRQRLFALNKNDGTKIPYNERRKFIDKFIFDFKSKHVWIDKNIEQKFIDISTRQASLDNMSTDEQIAEIINLIENYLKRDNSYINLDYETICDDFISDETVKKYRKCMQCFRHSTKSAIEERKSYSLDQKKFLVDYGLIILKTIHALQNDNNY